jgi:hypothetical protein
MGVVKELMVVKAQVLFLQRASKREFLNKARYSSDESRILLTQSNRVTITKCLVTISVRVDSITPSLTAITCIIRRSNFGGNEQMRNDDFVKNYHVRRIKHQI